MAGTSGLTPAIAAAAQVLDGRRVAVALSGGADSAGLLQLAYEYAEACRALHVDHGQPGSPAMEQAARAVAAAVGSPIRVLRVDVRDGSSFEAQARESRYTALLDALEGDEVLVTAHTADDDAETVLINLGRGTGLAGIAGIPAERHQVLRPFLGVRRHEILEFVRAASLPYADDPSNADPAFTRNRIRHEVLPAFEKALDRDPIPAMRRFARHAALARETVNLLARRVPIGVRAGVARVSLAQLDLCEPAVRSEVLRLVVSRGRPPSTPTTDELERVDAVARTRGVTELAGGAMVVASRTHLLVGPAPGPLPVALTWCGGTVSFDGWRLAQRTLPGAPTARLLTSTHRFVLARPETALTVRTVLAGDSVVIDSGRKSAAAAIAEAGIVRLARDRHPVVVDGEQVVWIPGVRSGGTSWENDPPRGYLSLDVVEEGPWK